MYPKPKIKAKIPSRCNGCGELGRCCQEPKVTPELQPSKDVLMRRQVKGALKAAISDHGPITKSLIGCVLKRLENQPVYRRLLDEQR